jgi:5-amino-6-(D-ribitylamino)uracil---L-tyrosine 4-hydroxyphenyl transferase
VTYAVNRNINFTNCCVKKCGFCAFSRTGVDEEAYLLPLEEIVRRAQEAVHSYGATELCVQAGLPPNMKGSLYPEIAAAIKEVSYHHNTVICYASTRSVS